jgi:hypothetical protein
LLKSPESTPKRLSPAMREMALDSDIAVVTLLLRGEQPVLPLKKSMKYTVIETQLPQKIQAAYDSITKVLHYSKPYTVHNKHCSKSVCSVGIVVLHLTECLTVCTSTSVGSGSNLVLVSAHSNNY